MADAAEVYRARPTDAEIDEVLAQRVVATVRAGRASVLVQGHASSGRSLMVSFEGTARVLRGPAAQELNHLLRAKYIQPGALPDVDRAWGRLDDVAVEVTPEKRRSWCGATLHEETQRELSMPYGEIWLEG